MMKLWVTAVIEVDDTRYKTIGPVEWIDRPDGHHLDPLLAVELRVQENFRYVEGLSITSLSQRNLDEAPL